MKILALLVAAVCFFISGCFGYVKPTESQKELNDQVIGAGDLISKTSVQAAVKQAGDDIVKAATTLQKTLIGEASVKKDYSHEEITKVVEKVVKEYDESQAPWYKRWAGTLLSALSTVAVVLGVAGYFYPPAGVVAGILKPVATTLTNMKQAADAHPSDSLTVESITAHINDLAKDPKIGAPLTTLLKDAHLDRLTSAPEASDPPPPIPPAPAPTA